MNDTVTKLMALADDYALWSSESQADDARKRLQDELTRLFTPLTEGQMMEIFQRRDGPDGDSFETHTDSPDAFIAFSRDVEAMHGITGESK